MCIPPLISNTNNRSFANDRVLGRFYPYGGIIEIDYPYDFYKKAAEYFFEDAEFEITRDEKELQAIGDGRYSKYLDCLSVWTHEMHHLYHSFSSPLSLLLHNLLTMRSSYTQSIALSAVSDNNDIIDQLTLGIGYIKFLTSSLYYDGYYNIIDTINMFNNFMPLLFEYYDMHFRNIGPLFDIYTNLPSNAFSSPSKAITPLKLMESYSFISQQLLIGKYVKRYQRKPLDMNNLDGVNCSEKYISAYYYYLDKLGIRPIEKSIYFHCLTYLVLVELSYKTPIGPYYMGLTDNKWENIHPSYRFERLLSVLKEVGYCEEPRDYELYTNKLCDNLGWPRGNDISNISGKVEYIRGTDEIGMDALEDKVLDVLTKYFIKTYIAINIMNTKWPYGPYEVSEEYLIHFNEYVKPAFSIFQDGIVKYDPIDIVIPRIKEFLMYVLGYDLEHNLYYQNILAYKNILMNSIDTLYGGTEYIDKDAYNIICEKILRGVFDSYGINYEMI